MERNDTEFDPGEKYWLGLFRTADNDIFIPPDDWTWYNSNILNVTQALTTPSTVWNNVIFQNFVWGKEDPIKVQCKLP